MPESAPKPKHAGGRPLLLTQALIAQVKDLVPRSLYVETIAAQIGVTSETFRDWIRTGTRERRRRELGQEPNEKLDLHCEFSSTVKKALADTESDHLQTIQAAGTGAWQAIAWVLERRFPQRWATNRGELRALAKQIAAIAKGAGGGQSGDKSGAARGTTGERPAPDVAAVE